MFVVAISCNFSIDHFLGFYNWSDHSGLTLLQYLYTLLGWSQLFCFLWRIVWCKINLNMDLLNIPVASSLPITASLLWWLPACYGGSVPTISKSAHEYTKRLIHRPCDLCEWYSPLVLPVCENVYVTSRQYTEVNMFSWELFFCKFCSMHTKVLILMCTDGCYMKPCVCLYYLDYPRWERLELPAIVTGWEEQLELWATCKSLWFVTWALFLAVCSLCWFQLPGNRSHDA